MLEATNEMKKLVEVADEIRDDLDMGNEMKYDGSSNKN